MANSKILALAKQFHSYKNQVKEMAEALKTLNAEWTAIESELLEAMVEEGVGSVKIDGLGNFILSTKTYLSLPAANRPQGYEYLKANGLGDIIKEYADPRTLGATLDLHFGNLVSQLQTNSELDIVDARKQAVELLNSKGFNYFSERTISLRKG